MLRWGAPGPMPGEQGAAEKFWGKQKQDEKATIMKKA
jgi:hypothetical protein